MTPESKFENVPNFVFSMISVPYITFTATMSAEGMGLALHANTMLIIPEVHCEMACFIMSVRSSSLTSSKHECWFGDGCELKQLLHSRFIFKYITDGKISILTSLDLSNESVKLVLSLSAISTLNFSNLFMSFGNLRNSKQRRKMCWVFFPIILQDLQMV